MKRILMMILVNIIHFPSMIYRLFKYSNNVEAYSFEERFSLIRDIVDYAFKGGRVAVESSGLENIPEEDGFILYPNHQGMFDVLAIVKLLDRPVTAIIKQELVKIPLLKRLIVILEAIPLDRSDARQGMKVILQVADDVKNGRNYMIFAEGTRSKNGNHVQAFKGGSFKSATKAKAPIVPVALIDCFKPFDTGSVDKVTVQVHFLEPLFYEDYKDMKTTEIASIVKERIQNKIMELRPEEFAGEESVESGE